MRQLLILLLLPLLTMQTALGHDVPDSLFTNPPAEARPLIIWQWMDGVVSREGITADLEAYSRAGLGGVQQFQIGGPLQGEIRDTANAIGSDNWRELMRHAISECQRLGLSFGTHNCPGWSSSAYPTVRPEDSMQKLVWTDTLIAGGRTVMLDLPQPEVDPRWNYYRDIAVLAMPADSVIRRETVVDLTGRTSWPLPAGMWRIIRFGHTTNGKTNANNAAYGGVGLECDKMSRDAVRKFWKGYPTLLLQLAGHAAGKTFNRIEIDSYEAGPQDWTPRMREEFASRRGYELLPWLPALTGLTIDSAAATARFKNDWTETITDLFAECYYGEMYQLVSQTPGMQLLIQPYGQPLDTWKCASQGESLLCTEFWVHSDWGWPHIPQVTSAARQLGRKMIYAEGFTCTPLIAWKDDPQSLKPYADRAFCLGVNRLMLHAGAQNPWPDVLPGMTFGKWGTQFTPGQTWWQSGGAKLLFDYFSRCQALLQLGDYVDDHTTGKGSLTADGDSIEWICRRENDTDLYFVVNAKDEEREVCITLQGGGRIPELWHPESGSREEALCWTTDGRTTSVMVTLSPRESLFIVMRQPTTSTGTTLKTVKPTVVKTIDLSKRWTVSFPEGWGAPGSIVLDSLTSWSEHTDSGVRYFSGTARYRQTLTMKRALKKGMRYVLDLGEVKNLARVFVNGKEAAHLWKKPFRCDVTDYLNGKANVIEIDVTNLWVNRMIGDEQEPDDTEWSEPFVYDYAPGNPEVGRFMKSIPQWLSAGSPRPSKGRRTVVSFKFFKKTDSLLPSGLLGPVRMLVLKKRP